MHRIPIARRPEPMAELAGMRKLFNFLRRRVVVIGLSGVAFAVLGGVAANVIAPRYTAEALLEVDLQLSNALRLETQTSSGMPDIAAVRSEVDKMSSPAVLGQAVDQLHLLDDPEFKLGLLRIPEPVKAYVQEAVGSVKDALGLPRTSAGEPVLPEDARRAEIIHAMEKRLTVENDGRSYTIRAKFAASSPEKATEILAVIVNAYLELQSKQFFEHSKQISEYLENRLNALADQVRKTDAAVQQYRSEHNLFESNGTSIDMQKLTELNRQLVTVGADRARAEARLQSARAAQGSLGSGRGNDALDDPQLNALRTYQAQLEQNLARLRQTLQDRHPAVMQAQAELNAIRPKIAAETGRIISALEREAEVQRGNEARIRASVQQLEQTVAKQSASSVELNRLMHEAQAAREIYDRSLEQFNRSSEQQRFRRNNTRVMSAANAGALPTFPNLPVLLAVGAAIGMVIGIVLALVLDELDSTFQTSRQVREAIGHRMLGVLPKLPWYNRRRARDEIVREPRSFFAESHRTIRAALMRGHGSGPPLQVIGVTSSTAGEGKTTFSISLSRILAQSGQKVILIDADLRRPAVKAALGQNAPATLQDVLLGKADLGQAINVDEATGAHYIVAGSEGGDPQRLLMSREFANVVGDLTAHYELIIVDTPPVMAVSDSMLLSSIVDGFVFLVRWASTPRDMAAEALQMLTARGARIEGVVMTQVGLKRYSKSGNYDQAHYHARHKYYLGGR